MVLMPDRDGRGVVAVTGTKLLLGGVLLAVVGTALETETFVYVGLLIGLAGFLVE